MGIHTLLISTQHTPTIGSITEEAAVQERIRADLWEAVVKPVFAELPIKPNSNTRFLTNPTGKFVIGGPQGDAGLTGRKIIVDTYGGYARHGGGAFSGKDPTKVDRSAAYAARYVAKNIVAAGLAQKCEVQVSYAIGVARPINLLVETFGTGRIPDEDLLRLVQRHFDLRPAAILAHFQLQELPRQRGDASIKMWQFTVTSAKPIWICLGSAPTKLPYCGRRLSPAQGLSCPEQEEQGSSREAGVGVGESTG